MFYTNTWLFFKPRVWLSSHFLYAPALLSMEPATSEHLSLQIADCSWSYHQLPANFLKVLTGIWTWIFDYLYMYFYRYSILYIYFSQIKPGISWNEHINNSKPFSDFWQSIVGLLPIFALISGWQTCYFWAQQWPSSVCSQHIFSEFTWDLPTAHQVVATQNES